MQNDIDTWYLESMFAHFRLAAHLIDCMDDITVADELAKSVNEIRRRLAALLGKPYEPQAPGEPAGSQAAEQPTEELEFARMLDDLCDSVARADAFSSAAESLIKEIMADEDRDDRRFAHLAHLVGVTSEAMQEADDVGHVLAIKFAQRWSRSDGAS